MELLSVSAIGSLIVLFIPLTSVFAATGLLSVAADISGSTVVCVLLACGCLLGCEGVLGCSVAAGVTVSVTKAIGWFRGPSISCESGSDSLSGNTFVVDLTIGMSSIRPKSSAIFCFAQSAPVLLGEQLLSLVATTVPLNSKSAVTPKTHK